MYCAKCGKELREGARFCAFCGQPTRTAVPPALPPPPDDTLYFGPETPQTPAPPPQVSYKPPPEHTPPSPPASYTPPPVYKPPAAPPGYSPPPYRPPAPLDQPLSPPPAEATQKKRLPLSAPVPRWLGILFGSLAALALIAALFLLLDPLKLHLWARLTGRYDAVATVMPADTQMYVSIDLLNLSPERLSRLQRTFADAVNQSQGANDLDQEIENLRRDLQDEWDINLETDILSWIGQYAGIGLRKVRFNNYGEPESADILAAFEVRNQANADAFLQKLINTWEEKEDVFFRESSYQNALIYELRPDYGEPIALARAGNMLFVGNGAKVVQQGIDAQGQNNLWEQALFQKTVEALPANRGVTLFVTAALADAFVEANDAGRRTLSKQGLDAMALAVSLIDEGIRLDNATVYNAATMSQAMADMRRSRPANVARILPANTVAFLSGTRPDLVWQVLRDAMRSTFGDESFNEAMAAFADEFGFDLNRDFFPLLNGDWAFVLVPSPEGAFARQTRIELGGAMLLQTSDANALNRLVEDAADTLGQWMDLESSRQNGRTVYELLNYDATPTYAFGMDGNYLAIATSASETGLASSGGGLERAGKYQQLWRAFPRGLTPMLYLDVAALVDIIGSGLTGYERDSFAEVEPFLRPITAVAGASKHDETTSQQTMIIFITMK